jgi:hypothetical protein
MNGKLAVESQKLITGTSISRATNTSYAPLNIHLYIQANNSEMTIYT